MRWRPFNFFLRAALLLTSAYTMSCSVVGGPPPHSDIYLNTCGGYIVLNTTQIPLDDVDMANIMSAKMSCERQFLCLNVYFKAPEGNSYDCRPKQ